MEEFIKENYLLNTKTARSLYRYASAMPIIDYHCHLSPKEIYEDKKFSTITEVWLGGDHYKWRLMRSAGIEERYITGDAADEEKFIAYAKALSLAIGNPLYEWSHMELKNYFGYSGSLDEASAKKVYKLANKKLKKLSARELIAASKVEVICTTDDPLDDLMYHQRLVKDEKRFKVLPTFRPDKIMNLNSDLWLGYIKDLEKISRISIKNYSDLLKAIKSRLDHFEKCGCRVSDHGLKRIPCREYKSTEISRIFRKALKKEKLTEVEEEKFMTATLFELMREYHARGWVAQLHYGVSRDNNTSLYKSLGTDCGGDHIGDNSGIDRLSRFLDMLERSDELPKTIIYSLDPNDNTAIDTVIASFQKGPVVSKLQHGSAWWFNDNYSGMMAHIKSLGEQGYLAGFVGMLTDSRSFLSYARHEYFRRILCLYLGELAETGRFPRDMKKLRKIVEDISYNNANEYFQF